MIKIFIVSLVNSTRRPVISTLCNKYGVEFEFIDAINGRELPDDFLNKINGYEWTRLKYRRPLGPSEVGCALSHHKIYRKNDNAECWFVVLEDDVSFDERFRILINANTSNLDKNSLYLLGGQEGLDSFRHVILSKFGKNAINQEIIFSRTLYSERFLFRTCCYLIHSSLASKILYFNSDKMILADDWYNLSKYKVIRKIYYIDLVKHPNDMDNSLIHSEREKFGKKNNNKTLRLLKKIALKVRTILRYF